MKPIFSDTRFLEQKAKHLFHFPEYIMMENAAAAIEKEVLSALEEIDGIKERTCENCRGTKSSSEKRAPLVVILCGSGNNGGDGYALSRRLFGKCSVLVLSFGGTKTDEAKRQAEMARSCGVHIIEAESAASCNGEEAFNLARVFVDCLYGSGFHGELNEKIAAFLEKINSIDAKKIACDISSGIDSFGRILSKDSCGERLAFKADKTIVMGALKTALFSDEAKDFTGRIEVAELGIARNVFENCADSALFDSAPSNQCSQSENAKPAMQSCSNDFVCSSECKAFPDAYLLEKTDITLPERNKHNVHKGQFGHCAVVIGEKAGAAIIAGTAALKSGAGLVTCVHFCRPHTFLMNPELMEDASFPEKTSAVLLGCGLGRTNTAAFNPTLDFIFGMKNPACVFDADFFYYDNIGDVLEKLCKTENARVILTPHPKELFALAKNCGIKDITEKFALEMRFETAKKIAALFPRIVLIAKGANTLIARGNELFVSECGSPALSKAGSGDVLAGFCAGLLAQGFNALEAAKTAVYLQGSASRLFENRWELSPLDLTRLSTAEDSLLFHL